MDVYYSPDYVASEYAFDTTRKPQWVAEALVADPISGVTLVAPPALDPALLARVHDPDYVAAVRSGHPRHLAESQGFTWDERFFAMVCASAGGVVAAALTALRSGGASGSLSTAQHHAHFDRGEGFCTFNGLAMAAVAAQDAGAKTVLILDLDAHGGAGTAELISGREGLWQSDISVNTYEAYDGGPRVRHAVHEVGATYLDAVARELARIDGEWPRFDLCLYYAGMDPHWKCDIGGCLGIDDRALIARDQMVFAWCRRRRLPVAFAIAGGYESPGFDRDDLAALHRATVAAAASTG